MNTEAEVIEMCIFKTYFNEGERLNIPTDPNSHQTPQSSALTPSCPCVSNNPKTIPRQKTIL